jgi:DNA adenine methylase
MTKPKPLVPWIGGKRKLAKHILPLPEHTCYVEPFCGAAGLYFCKQPSKAEVLNDVNGDIVNLYRVVKHHFSELYSQFKWVLISRESWETLKRVPPDTLTDIQRAARFLYLQKLAFGGKVAFQNFGTAAVTPPRFNLLSLEHDLAEAHVRLSRTTIEHLDWAACMKKYDRPGTLFYCDPPYWKVEGYGVEFRYEQYVQILDFMTSCKGKVILSINKHPDMDSLFSDLPKREIDYNYTVAGRPTKAVEVIYRNWGD